MAFMANLKAAERPPSQLAHRMDAGNSRVAHAWAATYGGWPVAHDPVLSPAHQLLAGGPSGVMLPGLWSHHPALSDSTVGLSPAHASFGYAALGLHPPPVATLAAASHSHTWAPVAHAQSSSWSASAGADGSTWSAEAPLHGAGTPPAARAGNALPQHHAGGDRSQ
jgi:hypothetical protein